MCIESVIPSSHLLLCYPLLLLPSIFPSIRDFSNELSLCIRWPKYWSFSFNISQSNEYSGLISLKSPRFHLLAAQGTLGSLLQPHSLKASILWLSAFFTVQFSQWYVTTGKTIALDYGSLSAEMDLRTHLRDMYILEESVPVNQSGQREALWGRGWEPDGESGNGFCCSPKG